MGVDRDVLIAAALVHDVGKTVEYRPATAAQPRIEITHRGRLIPHTISGPMAVQCVVGEHWSDLHAMGLGAGQVQVIVHCIAAHHGQKDWGAAVEPACPEAAILHLADLCSARLRTLLDQAERHGPDAHGWVMRPDRFAHKHPLFFLCRPGKDDDDHNDHDNPEVA